MKRTVLVAVALGATLWVAPSLAQPQIMFGFGPDGRPHVGIRDPEQERRERREYWRQRREEERARAYEEGRRDAWRDRRNGIYGAGYDDRCRTVTVQEENDWGRVVTRRFRRCD